MGIASFVIGIIAVIISLIPLIGALAVVGAIPAFILACLDLFWRKKSKGLSIAGLTLAIICGLISFMQYKAVEAVDEGLNELAAEVGAPRSVEVKATAKNNTEQPVKIHNIYEISHNNARVQVVELENTSSKNIKAIRGHLVFYDEFDKESKRSLATYRNLAAGKRKIIANISANGQAQTLEAQTMQELQASFPLPFEHFKISLPVKFIGIDIKYAE